MRKSIKKILMCTSAACLIGSFVFVATNLITRADDVGLKAEYVKGETIEIPDRTLGTGSNSKKVKPTIYSPSGKKYTDNSVLLREMGEYEVVYTAEIDGKTVTEREEFRRVSPIYSIEGSGTYEYKANETTPNTYGINVELSSGSSLVYNKIIDLNELPNNAKLLKLYVVPETIGYCDFRQINVTLTDIYDPANQVIIEGNNVADGYHDGIWDYEYARYMMYMRAGTVLSTPRGFERSTLHIGNTYGYPSSNSFCGLLTSKLETDIFSFSFDYDTKQVIRKGGLVVDLDDPAHFTDVWGGFTTGEVELSISLSSFVNTTGSFVLTEIAGEKLGGQTTFYDTEAPELTVDYGDYTKNTIPSVGVGNSYRLFDATAQDTYSGKTEVIKKVFYDYVGAKEAISVVDGAFVPTKAGIYTIEYTAIDYCGNVAKETCEIEVTSGYALISAGFVNGTKTTKALAGVWTSIAEIQVGGGYGKLQTMVKAFAPDGKECEILDGKILPVKAGEYQIVYTVSDYVGQTKTVRYEISVSANDSPVFVEDTVLYRNYMNGYSYELPKLEAYKADGNSLKPIKTEIVVSDSNGTRTLSDNVYIPSVSTDGADIKVVYRATSNGKTVEKEYKGKGYITRGTQGLQMEKFFVATSGIKALSKSDSLEYSTAINGSKMEFINPLLANSFSLMMNFSKMQPTFNLKFVLEDFESAKIKAEVELVANNGEYSLWVNGVENKLPSFKTGETSDYYLLFDNIRSRVGVKDSSNTTSYYSTSNQGIYFPSGKVYLTIEFSNMTVENTLILKKLNEQYLARMAVDLLRPSIDIFIDTVGNKYELGDIAIASKAVGLDVLDPFVKTVLTVRDAEGNVVRDCMTGVVLNGVPCDQEYRFMIEKVGDYTVTYQATDSQNRTTPYQYVVSMTDSEAPTLSLYYDIVTEATIGDYVYVPEGKGQDNVDGEVKVYYYVLTPNCVTHALDREKYDGFEVTAKGTYVIRYALYDQYGNLAVYDYTIDVK